MADRGEVKIREARINDLLSLYKRAYVDLVKEIEAATLAGKIRKGQVMARIKRILTELGEDVDGWVQAEIPQYYLDGANIAIQDLKDMGVDVTKGITVIDKQAIAALVDEVNLAFAEGMTAIGRNARTVLNDALKRQLQFIIADGRLKGETLKAIANEVTQRLKDEGLAVLIDKGGRRWEFDRYSEMLVRTKAVEARNQGLANRMLQSGWDLVQVSNHNSDHVECAVWEGKILSLTGKTPTGTELPGGYEVAGTVAQATAAGLFHPNCQHAINVIKPTLAAKTQAYDNPFNKK